MLGSFRGSNRFAPKVRRPPLDAGAAKEEPGGRRCAMARGDYPVPHYNINLRTTSTIADSWPVERDDLTALRVELARFVGEMLKDHANQIWADEDWRVDVTDETGLILYVMHVSASDTAATMPMGTP